jgi:transposase
MHVMMRMEFDRIDHVAFTVRRRRVARLHEKIASVRRNVQHQTAHTLVRTPSLARSSSDAAWDEFIAILVGKAEGAGRQTVARDPMVSSVL